MNNVDCIGCTQTSSLFSFITKDFTLTGSTISNCNKRIISSSGYNTLFHVTLKDGMTGFASLDVLSGGTFSDIIGSEGTILRV